MHLGVLPLGLLTKIYTHLMCPPCMIQPFPMSINILLYSGLKLNCGLNMRILRRENMEGKGEFEQRQNMNTKNERGKGRRKK